MTAGDRNGNLLDSMLSDHRDRHAARRGLKQRYYPMLGFGNFESASRFSSAFDELRDYFRVKRRGQPVVSLAEQ